LTKAARRLVGAIILLFGLALLFLGARSDQLANLDKILR